MGLLPSNNSPNDDECPYRYGERKDSGGHEHQKYRARLALQLTRKGNDSNPGGHEQQAKIGQEAVGGRFGFRKETEPKRLAELHRDKEKDQAHDWAGERNPGGEDEAFPQQLKQQQKCNSLDHPKFRSNRV